MDLKKLAEMAKSEGVTSGAVHALIEAVEAMPDKPAPPGKLPEKPLSPPPGQPLVPPKPASPTPAQKIMADRDFTPKESDKFIKQYGEDRIVAEDAKEKGKK